MIEFPDDVLIIHYNKLGHNPPDRLRTLGAIGTLLGKPVGFYTPVALELSPNLWLYLQCWLEQDNGITFWQSESQGVRVLRPCKKHVLVGTGQLLLDLKEELHTSPMIQPHTLETIWGTVQRYVIENVAQTTR